MAVRSSLAKVRQGAVPPSTLGGPGGDAGRGGPQAQPHGAGVLGLPVVLWVLILACTLPEAVLEAADAGLLGTRLWRIAAYESGAFWAGLLHGWQPDFLLQPELMFLTYSFLHAGPWHLIGNMLALCYLGPPAVARLGPWRFLALWTLSAIGGGIGFGLLSRSPAPMVGASGALFGLLGAWMVWDARSRRARGLPDRRPWIMIAAILGNAALWWSKGGLLAWQTHLGGFLAGAAAAMALTPRAAGRGNGTIS